MVTPSANSWRSYLWWLLAAAWFSCWHFWHTWPVWHDPLYRVPGPIGDNTVMLWNLGWVRYALNHGQPGFWFTNAYYPEGFLFLFGTHTWLDGVLGWLASPFLPSGYQGCILWANIMMLVATTASGLLVISILRAWGVWRWPVLLLASSAAVFCWFRMFALTGHYHFYGTEWMLGSLALLSWARRSSVILDENCGRRLAIAAGLILGITFLNDQTMAVFAGVLGGLILVSIPAENALNWWRNLRQFGLRFYGWALLPASIHLVPIVVAIKDGRFQYKIDTATLRLVDASSFFLPSERHWLGRPLQHFRERHGLIWSEGSYLGLASMALLALVIGAGAYYITRKKAERPPALRVCFYTGVAALVFLVLALGDTFVVGRHQFFPLPGRLLKSVPLLNGIRLPQRWVWPAHLCIVLGGARILSLLLDKYGNRLMYWAVLLLALVPPLEARNYPQLPPVDFRNDTFLQPPGLIQSVKARYKTGAVMVMPIAIAYAHSNIFQFLWGYDIPATITYTARMPFNVQQLPWKGNKWTPETAKWLKDKRVSIIVFPYHKGKVEDYQPWITEAKRAVPGLIVLNQNGQEI